jgi:hypothetical protein
MGLEREDEPSVSAGVAERVERGGYGDSIRARAAELLGGGQAAQTERGAPTPALGPELPGRFTFA